MGQNTRAQRSEYIHNYTRTLAGQLHINSESFTGCWNITDVLEDVLGRQLHVAIGGRIRKLDDQTVGRLACCGEGSEASIPSLGTHFDELARRHTDNVHYLSFFEGRDSFGIVFAVATFSVVAAMIDNIWADVRKLRDAAKKAEEARREAEEQYNREVHPFM